MKRYFSTVTRQWYRRMEEAIQDSGELDYLLSPDGGDLYYCRDDGTYKLVMRGSRLPKPEEPKPTEGGNKD